MRVCVLSGGVGSARFCSGLVKTVDPPLVTIVVNTADDERMRGLHVSPDVDTVLYHLADQTDWERGWGLDKESFAANDRYRELVARLDLDVDLQEWFALGDRDLATHLLRTRLLDAGLTLTEATDSLRRGMGIGARVLPMSDEAVRTHLVTPAGENLDFQTYFVRRHHAEEISGVTYEGAERAQPAPGVLEAVGESDVLVIPPSNPLLSIEPIMAVPGVREALASASGKRVAVSPIVGGRALKGPADNLLAWLGHEPSALGVARIYRDLVDIFVLDQIDESLAPAVEGLGLRAVVCDTIMSGPQSAARLAAQVLEHAA